MQLKIVLVSRLVSKDLEILVIIISIIYISFKKNYDLVLHFFLFADGLDFFFGFEPYARKLVDFLQSQVPCRYNTSKKLISHDQNSNTYNYKYVFSVEVVPICKDNVVCLPIRLARSLGKCMNKYLRMISLKE